MKVIPSSIALVLALLTFTARADLIYINNLGVVAERASLRIFLSLRPPDKQGHSKIMVTVGAGHGATGNIEIGRVTPIMDYAKARTAMTNLLAILNDPAIVQIDVMLAMQQAGWTL